MGKKKNAAPANALKHPNAIGIKESLGYTFGDIGNLLVLTFISSYLKVFYTDSLTIQLKKPESSTPTIQLKKPESSTPTIQLKKPESSTPTIQLKKPESSAAPAKKVGEAPVPPERKLTLKLKNQPSQPKELPKNIIPGLNIPNMPPQAPQQKQEEQKPAEAAQQAEQPPVAAPVETPTPVPEAVPEDDKKKGKLPTSIRLIMRF